MPESPQKSRWQEIVDLWESRPYLLFGIAGYTLGILSFPVIQFITQNFGNFLIDVVVAGAIQTLFTILVIDRLNERRNKRQQLEELKNRLLQEVRGSSNEVAKAAIDKLRNQGWLTGETGLLKNLSFEQANLQGVNLSYANLEKASFYQTNLDYANLTGANMRGVSMQETSMRYANLQETDLSYSGLDCDLTGAWLEHTLMGNSYFAHVNFTDAMMSWVSLYDTDMRGAKLTKTRFSGKNMNGKTLLPDGATWTEETDMRKFGCIVEK